MQVLQLIQDLTIKYYIITAQAFRVRISSAGNGQRRQTATFSSPV